jgi:Ca-activated chloride channel family protein
MTAESILPLSLLAAGAAFLFVVLCEFIHARRGARLARLAFGPDERSRRWTRGVPAFRAVAVAGLCWSLTYLLLMNALQDPLKIDPQHDLAEDAEELVFLLDYSPSMLLEDSGSDAMTARRDRMAAVISAILDRAGPHVRYTLICFYTKPLPIVRSAFDKAIVRNVLNDLPVERAMSSGKTDLGGAVAKAIEIARDFPPQSTTLILATDGDTDNPPIIGEVPEALDQALVLGVGDPKVGQPIDGHLSRQDTDLLKELATNLEGRYLNVNHEHVPGTAISHLLSSPDAPLRARWTLTRVAYTLFIALAVMYALLPIAQEYFGSSWRPSRIKPEADRA